MGADVSRGASDQRAERAQLILLSAAVLLALMAWMYLCFWSQGGLVTGYATVAEVTRTPFQAGAFGDIALLAIPLALTLVPFISPRAWRSKLTLIAAIGALIAAIVLALNGVGWFFLPAIAALIAAYFVPATMGGQRPGLARTNWYLLGAIVVALPGILLIGAMAAGTFAWSPVTVGVASGCVALAAVLARGIRWVALVVGLLGLVAMVASALDGGLLTLAFWVLGGFWLVTGLAALVAAGRVKHTEARS